MTQSVFTQTDETFGSFGYETNMTRDTRVYLECPYHEKEEVKALGARWDNTQRRWYAPPGIDLKPLFPWMKERYYLRCGKEDQKIIEELGAKYDPTICNYYILDTMDKEPFSQWLP